MLIGYLCLLAFWFCFTLLALLKQRHFRGFDVPARVCYSLLVLDQIWVAMELWLISSVLMVVMITFLLILIGLVETGFRNKLQNNLSRQFVWVIIMGFGIDIVMTLFIVIRL